MFFGIGTFVAYIVFMSNFNDLTITQAKNFLIFIPVLFVLAIIELFGEFKFGFKKIFKLISFIFNPKTYKKIKYKKLKSKIEHGKTLTQKQINWLKKYKESEKQNVS